MIVYTEQPKVNSQTPGISRWIIKVNGHKINILTKYFTLQTQTLRPRKMPTSIQILSKWWLSAQCSTFFLHVCISSLALFEGHKLQKFFDSSPLQSNRGQFHISVPISPRHQDIPKCCWLQWPPRGNEGSNWGKQNNDFLKHGVLTDLSFCFCHKFRVKIIHSDWIPPQWIL